MDAISSRLRKSKGKPSNKNLATRNKAKTQWSSLQNKLKCDSKIINKIHTSSVSNDMGENDCTVTVPSTASDRKLNKVLPLSSKCVSSEVGDMKGVPSYVITQSKMSAIHM